MVETHLVKQVENSDGVRPENFTHMDFIAQKKAMQTPNASLLL